MTHHGFDFDKGRSKKTILFFLIFFVSILIISCASTQTQTTLQKPPAFKILQSTLVKEIGSQGAPKNPSSVYTTDDKRVVSHIKYANLSGKRDLKWKWYDPDGKLYQATGDFPVQPRRGKWVKEGFASHMISIKDTQAAKHPGRWSVNVMLDGDLVAKETFLVRKIPGSRAKIAGSNFDFGNYHALVIGNNHYQDDSLPDLKSAIKDARAVEDLLKTKYGFKTTLLTDATRKEVLGALSDYRKMLSKRDNFLVYYAGHGYLDKGSDAGYWLPVDASGEDDVQYIPIGSITSTIKGMRAKQVLVVADSCYSGTLTRAVRKNPYTTDYHRKMSNKRSRTALTSGGLEPVIDSGGEDGHSVFASAFMDVLKDNREVIDGTDLFSKLRRQVMVNADQTPRYADIRKAGHYGGDFIFVPTQ